jgi:bifunctional non-homologous end joining protein LigD
MADPTQIEVPGRIYWRYQDARSNKDYITSLERVGDLWIANYAFGAHGATLKPGTKMSKGPGTYAQARKVYDAMVKERLAKGYKPQDGEGSAYVADPGGQRHSGIQCQLLNPIGEDEAQALIGDDGWFSQEKHDGKRMLIRKAGQEVCGINRRGLLVGFPKAVEQAALAIPHDFVIDGEAIGERLHAFDVLEAFGADQRALGAYERLSVLRRLLEGCGEGAISFSTPAVTTGEKQALHDRLLAARREGLVFKRKDAAYVAGRPNSGGNQLKRKFYETASFVAGAANDQRSIAVMVSQPAGDGVEWIQVGNCTIPSNHKVPEEGAVVEIRYRHAYPGGGLQEPVYLGVRTDIGADECTADQLNYKAAA